MVLVLAAIYTYYQQRQQQKLNNLSAHDEKDATDNNNTSSSSPQQELHRQLSRHLQTAVTGGKDLYQTAVLRCSPQQAAPQDCRTMTDQRGSGPVSVDSVSTGDPSSVVGPDNIDAAGSMTALEQEIFSPEIRKEWINAVFGEDFLPLRTTETTAAVPPSRQGVGLSQIPSYVTYQTTIPANCSGERVGVTISRLALGLYVRRVEPESEAFFAGVLPDSVLVSVNGMGMLGEPSRQALARLWQYEGYLEDAADYQPLIFDRISSAGTTTSTGSSAAVAASASIERRRRVAREPVALQFIRKGEMYTVLMLSYPPWGIQWAPCGNFALVRRSYSFAAAAGIKKGSIVADVNGTGLRELDHRAAAGQLRQLFEAGQEIRMTLCFTPAASRTGHYERIHNSGLDNVKQRKKEPKSIVMSKTQDGIEVRVHPLEYVIGSLCHAGGIHEDDDIEELVQELAEKVSAGIVEAPTGKMQRKMLLDGGIVSRSNLNKYAAFGPCPVLTQEELLEIWDPVQALVYCLQFDRVGYHEANFGRSLKLLSGEESLIDALRRLTTGPTAASTASHYLLQFISLICSPDHYVAAAESEEKKMDDPDSVGTSPRRNANELTSMLLKLSRRDADFCQRLYFLLRSYISTFETSKPSIGEEGDSRNLTALLHCLELLRFAEKELAGRTVSATRSSAAALESPSSPKMTDGAIASISTVDPSPVPSPVSVSPGSMSSQEDSRSPEKKRGVLGLFRKKKSKKQSSKASSSGGSRSASKSSRQPSVNVPKGSSSQASEESEQNSEQTVLTSLSQSPSTMYENMSDFLSELDRICATIERSLQKSFRQKIADWALQPWSASKDTALAQVTVSMRDSLRQVGDSSNQLLLANPVESSELLSSVDYDECYILPSAHFPILLTFNVSERRCSDSVVGEERLYRTMVELVSVRGSSVKDGASFTVHGAVAGTILESGKSFSSGPGSKSHCWKQRNCLVFETRSSWGAPQTLSLRLSEDDSEAGFCWVDLSKQWDFFEKSKSSVRAKCVAEVRPVDSANSMFDEHGDLPSSAAPIAGRLDLELRITTERIAFDNTGRGKLSRKRMLLYKHDDDLRQEAFAIQFIQTCDSILKASGLDMKLLTFQCIPVGTKRGFVEWVPGSVPLSEICQTFAGCILGNNEKQAAADDESESPSMFAKAGINKYESLRRLGGQQTESLQQLGSDQISARGSVGNNPVQDYLRSVAYAPLAPYLIRKDAMDTYVKSCAGYSVITYILGCGDRHLDNVLLHQSGSFFHCDYSFILGIDPKKYLPMRITEDMVDGMGGKHSDNYAKFLSLVGAAFLALRRPENVRILLNMVRLMEASHLPDISENQTIEEAVLGVRDRLRLDLSEERAVMFMEEMVEASLSNKLWLAVDAIHNLGKKF